LAVCGGSHIGNDMVMVSDFVRHLHLDSPAKMQCLLLALCVEGECKYVVDTVERTAHPNDIVIIGKGQPLFPHHRHRHVLQFL